MTKLDLIGWRPGLDTVALISAVRLHTSMSLAIAKREVERLLDGETISLEFPTEDSRDEFREKVDRLGVRVR